MVLTEDAWMGIIFISHRHDAWPHAWMDEKHVNPPSYYITVDMGSEGCSLSGTQIPTCQTSQFNLSHRHECVLERECEIVPTRVLQSAHIGRR